MDKKVFCNKHLCESCKHILHEKGENVSQCDFECLTRATDIDLDIICSNCGTNLGNCEDLRNLKQTQLSLVESAIKNPQITVVCFIAPSVRASISEVLCDGKFEDVQGKLVTALKKIGFDVVFDMNVAADFTTIEEAHEFIKRLETGKNLPMMTSCCPGWVNYVTKFYKEFIPNLSTCKSPQQMFGTLINTYYVDTLKKKSTDIFVVSIVPCLAKKLEAKQIGINSSIGYDVDAAITTTEIIEMIEKNKIKFKDLEPSSFDSFFGESSGAGVIFGNTGGVMEAVLRTVGDEIEKEDINELMYELVRGQEGIRRKTIKLKNRTINVAVVSGIINVKPILEEIKQGKANYDFIEVMACPGGCVGGGGQPRQYLTKQEEHIKQRAKVLYNKELNTKTKKAHKNLSVIKVYENFIGPIGGRKAKKLLHRKYIEK